MEEDTDFMYIALERAICTLEDKIEKKAKYIGPAIDNISILRQAANGLKWLHTRNISKKPPHMPTG